MRIAYLDCGSGISGDMTLGALIDCGVDAAAIQAGLDSLAWPDGAQAPCRLRVEEVKKRGFRATQVTVEHPPEHAHRHLHHIAAMIEGSGLTEKQQSLALEIFARIARAEAKVHGTTLEKVHFHEVGALDSIADIVGAAIGWDLLGVDRVVASPVAVGSGHIHIAHGRCSVPAPATTELLTDVPLSDFAPEGELTTPTGAAIVSTLADSYGPMPAMRISSIGYGAGQKDFDHANLVRLVVGEAANTSPGDGSPASDSITLLETNLDDSPGEAIGDCVDRLRRAGALDVSLTPLQMKKDRPGVLLAVQSPPDLADDLESLIFRHTTALGIRRQVLARRVLPRRKALVSTGFGEVAGVVATLPSGAERFTPEHDSCREVADAACAAGGDVTLRDVYMAAVSAYAERGEQG
ncbi:MAG: nickel pincer cofactor biosynthesis protein LarC [Planctomycetota bacterium]